MDPTCGTGALGLDRAVTAALVDLAGRGPWPPDGPGPRRWRARPDRIELRAAPDRAPADAGEACALRMGHGAALLVLRLGLTGRGVRPLVTRFPDPADPGLVAVVRHGGTVRATPEQRRLLAAASGHRPDRHPGGARPVPRSSRFVLRRAAVDEGAWLQPLPGPGDPRGQEGPETLVAELSVHGDGPREELRAGEALQRVLLAATAEGLVARVVSAAPAGPRGRAGGTRRPRVLLRLVRTAPGPAPGAALGRPAP